MGRTAMRTVVIAVVALGFLSILASIAFNWSATQWIAPIGYALLAIGLALGVVRRLLRHRRESRESSPELSASDEFSDLQLGRRPITHYPHDDAGTSQIGDPPQHPRPPV